MVSVSYAHHCTPTSDGLGSSARIVWISTFQVTAAGGVGFAKIYGWYGMYLMACKSRQVCFAKYVLENPCGKAHMNQSPKREEKTREQQKRVWLLPSQTFESRKAFASICHTQHYREPRQVSVLDKTRTVKQIWVDPRRALQHKIFTRNVSERLQPSCCQKPTLTKTADEITWLPTWKALGQRARVFLPAAPSSMTPCTNTWCALITVDSTISR